VRLTNFIRGLTGRTDSFQITFEGHRFLIPKRPGSDYLLDLMARKRSFYEADLLRALKSAVAPGGIALDCGANIGNHALFFAGVMGLKTYAFEPVETNLEVLRKLVALNGLEGRIEVMPLALSDAAGVLWLDAPDPVNPGTFRETSEGIGERVAAVRLDDILREHGIPLASVHVVKIDVEGQEYKVLAGATRLLSEGKAVLAIETMSVEKFERLLALLGPVGYRPTEVHCATPTVIFRRDGGDAEAEVRARLAGYTAGAAQ
jgi:FkbM family methyltransferase